MSDAYFMVVRLKQLSFLFFFRSGFKGNQRCLFEESRRVLDNFIFSSILFTASSLIKLIRRKPCASLFIQNVFLRRPGAEKRVCKEIGKKRTAGRTRGISLVSISFFDVGERDIDIARCDALKSIRGKTHKTVYVGIFLEISEIIDEGNDAGVHTYAPSTERILRFLFFSSKAYRRFLPKRVCPKPVDWEAGTLKQLILISVLVWVDSCKRKIQTAFFIVIRLEDSK